MVKGETYISCLFEYQYIANLNVDKAKEVTTFFQFLCKN